MAVDPGRAFLWATAAALAVNAGYLIAVRRRSRRAAAIALAGVGLFGLSYGQMVTGDIHATLSQAVFADDRQSAFVMALWTRAAYNSLAYALLVWAVLADRPPAIHDSE